jgi:Domain of unknown function (DUF1816)
MKFVNISLLSHQATLHSKKIPMQISEIWTNTLDFCGQAWWIEISTSKPSCTYYFGPFANAKKAEVESLGYIEDLEGESAQGIKTQIKRCKPNLLTIDHENEQYPNNLINIVNY